MKENKLQKITTAYHGEVKMIAIETGFSQFYVKRALDGDAPDTPAVLFIRGYYDYILRQRQERIEAMASTLKSIQELKKKTTKKQKPTEQSPEVEPVPATVKIKKNKVVENNN